MASPCQPGLIRATRSSVKAPLVEFHTPAHTDGMGTYLFLKKDANPVDGAVILRGRTLNEQPDVVFVFCRLPAKLTSLTPFIVRQAESEALRPAGNGTTLH